MTQPTLETQRGRRRGHLLIASVAIIALVCSGAARWLAQQQRERITPQPVLAGLQDRREAELGQLNSYALALLLGGLRGPLVMALWSNTEDQRSQRDLESLDTQIELIRLLQPQFDTVHLFQIWNKGYNVSAELASLAGKYAAILDGIEYGRRVAAERSASINIELAIADLYYSKLGNGQERDYFRPRVRQETAAPEDFVRITFTASRQADVEDAALAAGFSPRLLAFRQTESPGTLVTAVPDTVAPSVIAALGDDVIETRTLPYVEQSATAGRPVRLRPMLLPNGNLRPELLGPLQDQPADVPTESAFEGTAGGELAYLAEFQPYPDGLSPFALAYNYFKRAQVLQVSGGQRAIQRGEGIVSSNPARALRDWAEDAYTESRRAEIEAFGLDLATEAAANEIATAALPPDAEPVSPQLLQQAIRFYDRTQQISAAGVEEFNEHLTRYPSDETQFRSMIEWLELLNDMARADALYARMMAGEATGREATLSQVRQLYADLIEQHKRYMLRYYAVPDVFPPGTSEPQAYELPDDLVNVIYSDLRRFAATQALQYPHETILSEFEGYIARAQLRLQQLN